MSKGMCCLGAAVEPSVLGDMPFGASTGGLCLRGLAVLRQRVRQRVWRVLGNTLSWDSRKELSFGTSCSGTAGEQSARLAVWGQQVRNVPLSSGTRCLGTASECVLGNTRSRGSGCGRCLFKRTALGKAGEVVSLGDTLSWTGRGGLFPEDTLGQRVDRSAAGSLCRWADR